MAFRECFGGVSRVLWWRFEGALMTFREGFNGVLKSALLTIAQCLSYE